MKEKSENSIATETDKEEIEKLLIQVLKWSDSKESISLLPALTDSKDSIVIGFDMEELKTNLERLKETGFYANEFIENYNQIILTLDRKLRNKEFKYETWFVGDLPIFKFANGWNPWCCCQDYAVSQLEGVEIVKLNDKFGELKCKRTEGSSWIDFKFNVVKEDNKWKISYMQGFDFEEGTKGDGEL
jgi:hypothetical protein